MITGSAQISSGSAHPVILCVDDEVMPLTIRQIVLESAGFRVVTANSGKAALEVLQSRQVALILSDHLMPEMTGAELAAQVKRLHPEIPFVLLSGVNDLPKGAELADEFLSKLEGPEAMIERIRSLLSIRE